MVAAPLSASAQEILPDCRFEDIGVELGSLGSCRNRRGYLDARDKHRFVGGSGRQGHRDSRPGFHAWAILPLHLGRQYNDLWLRGGDCCERKRRWSWLPPAVPGRMGKALNALPSALQLFDLCVKLAQNCCEIHGSRINDQRWPVLLRGEYELMSSLWLERAECELLTGEFDTVGRLIEQLLLQAKSKVDQTSVYQLKVQLHLLKGEAQETLDTALACLRGFAIDMQYLTRRYFGLKRRANVQHWLVRVPNKTIEKPNYTYGWLCRWSPYPVLAMVLSLGRR